MGEAELEDSVSVHAVEQLELAGQLVGLLPPGGEPGAPAVVVVVGQLPARVGVPAEGPEAKQVDPLAHGGSQRVHQDAGAEALWRQLLGFPVAVEHKQQKSAHRHGNGQHIWTPPPRLASYPRVLEVLKAVPAASAESFFPGG